MTKPLADRIAVVTGASSGMGRAHAEVLAERGAHVIVQDIREERAGTVADAIRSAGGSAEAMGGDASDVPDMQRRMREAEGRHGRIDILVNNAGITRDNLLMRMTESDWDLVIKVNLKSVFNMTKAAQKYMLKQRSGSIINMSSVVGVGGNAGQSNYSASKAGLIGFTKSIAQELGSRNIRCNAIAPGFIETEMTARLTPDVREAWIKEIPLRRGGTPKDVARTALFLASDLSDYITGQVIAVCGGMTT